MLSRGSKLLCNKQFDHWVKSGFVVVERPVGSMQAFGKSTGLLPDLVSKQRSGSASEKVLKLLDAREDAARSLLPEEVEKKSKRISALVTTTDFQPRKQILPRVVLSYAGVCLSLTL